MANYFNNKKIETKKGLIILVLVFLIAFFGIWLNYKNFEFETLLPIKISFPEILPKPSIVSKVEGIAAFSSEEDLKDYLAKGKIFGHDEIYGLDILDIRKTTEASIEVETPIGMQEALTPERVSETNVQVSGIDEPDILKTNGKEIYFSPGRIWPVWREPIIMEKIIPPYPYEEPKTKIIKAFPPEDLMVTAEIKDLGDLLLIEDKNILVIFSDKEIFGYDVSNPQSPQKKWEIKLDEKNSLVTSRLYNNKIYLITKNLIDEVKPCPIKPLSVEGKEVEIKCSDIYHPIHPVAVDVTFLAMILDPSSGQIENKISFIGSSGQSIVYMSENAVYITYSYYESISKFYSQFLKDKCSDLVPNWVLEKTEKLEGYDISQEAKLLELQTILEKYQNSLSEDERLRIENELHNRISDYYKAKKRDLEKSGILKINLDDFKIAAHGNVPGFALNQFALDEYQGNLRIAVTVGERMGSFGFGIRQGESANDIYVLDNDLKIIGMIEDLGLTEKIYSARFIGDKGYLVTFRQIDPFYILDLSNPQKPELKGELKIPGYSSYLHPIDKDKILGIGREDWQVKISLFDVSDPKEPKEVNKYILNEGWSDILNTHHAFLLDKKHQIFFLPGASGAYIFSYKNDKLELIKAVSQISAKRAIYINDFLYIVGDDEITVLDENNWEKIKEYSLE